MEEPPGNTSAVEFLLARAANAGKGVYLEDGASGRQITYEEMPILAKNAASWFFKNGLQLGDIVIYATTQVIHQVPLMLGIWRANGVCRSIYADESAEVLLQKVIESDCKFLFCDMENLQGNINIFNWQRADTFILIYACKEVKKRVTWDLKVVLCEIKSDDGIQSIDDLFQDDGMQCPKLEVDGSHLALILPTSGTTGPSKGAMYTQWQVCLHARQRSFPYALSNQWNLLGTKASHQSGHVFPLAIMIRGLRAVVLSRVDGDILIKAVDKYKPGFVSAFPTFLLHLATRAANSGYDVTSVETIWTGGVPINEEMKKAWLSLPNVKGVIVAYGMTEGGLVATTSGHDENSNPNYLQKVPAGSVGLPLFPEATKVEIRDLDTLEKVGTGVKGEICAKGDTLFQGYFKDKAATVASMTSDGFFRTGDVGYLDEKGFLFVTDRAKDIFKYFHNHISPSEIEAVIMEVPGVKEVCVLAHPDPGGEVPIAVVSLKSSFATSDLEAEAFKIKKYAEAKLPSYKHLRGGVFIMEQLPRGKTGKVTRSLVAQALADEEGLLYGHLYLN